MLYVSTASSKQGDQAQRMTTQVERVNQVHHFDLLLQDGVGATLEGDTGKDAGVKCELPHPSLSTPESPAAGGLPLSTGKAQRPTRWFPSQTRHPHDPPAFLPFFSKPWVEKQ